MGLVEKSTKNSQRVGYFDTLRFLAMLIIYVTHFIAKFCPDYFVFWKTMPTSILLYDITGKFGVVLFGVLLGYFAYLNKDNNSTRYIVKRYSFFAFSGLLINLVYALAGVFIEGFPAYSIKNVLIESILLDDGIFVTYWCIQFFFFGSIISYINGKANVSFVVILFEIFISYLLGFDWVGVCLVGNLLGMFMARKITIRLLKHRVVRIVSLVLLFFAIKLPTYLFDAVWCSLIIIVIENSTITKKILNNKFTSYLGQQGMGVYLFHPICYSVLGPYLFDWLSPLPYELSFCLTIITCLVVIIVISIPSVKFINFVIKKIGDWVVLLQTKMKKRINHNN